MTENLTVLAVAVFQLGFGFLLGWIRWGRHCVRRHDWAPRHFGVHVYEECLRCGRSRG